MVVLNGFPARVAPGTRASVLKAPLASWHLRHWLIMMACTAGSRTLLPRLRLNWLNVRSTPVEV